MSAANLPKAFADAAQILTSALNAVPGASVVTIAVADAQAIKDLLDQGILALPPFDASSLDPSDRAAADASAATSENEKFPPSKS